MNSAAYVDNLIADLKAAGVPLQQIAWEAAKACVGWPYVFGARGGKTTKNGVTVRQFDCRGFTYWILLAVYGWKLMGAGCTSQWNDENNWKAKGEVSALPTDTLCCLFYREKDDPRKMAHTGFYFNGETVECSKGVQYSKTRNKKWQYWAVPVCIDGEVTPSPAPEPSVKRPTIRRGNRNTYVKECQTMLQQLGYNLGICGIDGDFGSATLAAVEMFQREHGLTVDGIVGPATWAALDKAVAEKQQSPPEEPITLDLYTVHLPNLPLYKAEAIVSQYEGAWMEKEGSGD